MKDKEGIRSQSQKDRTSKKQEIKKKSTKARDEHGATSKQDK